MRLEGRSVVITLDWGEWPCDLSPLHELSHQTTTLDLLYCLPGHPCKLLFSICPRLRLVSLVIMSGILQLQPSRHLSASSSRVSIIPYLHLQSLFPVTLVVALTDPS